MAGQQADTAAPREEAGRFELPKAYRPADIEPQTYARWLAADVFAPDGRGSRADQALAPFVIVQPPPNVTGALHMGHALTATTEDVIVRRSRMKGAPTLWLPGVDHASIAAQFVLDQLIAAEGETRESLGRQRYLERMRAFMDETRGVIGGQHRRLGVSVDWNRERFTMDEGSARSVRVAFKQLYDDGLAYRGERLINWCPGCRTSLSDLEVVPTPENGTLWFVRYHLVDAAGAPLPDETISVATTRPETILGDTGVAVHPDDPRYRALIGRKVLIPFVDRVVEIVADGVVEPGFGTGAVKITPAHDFDDFETGRRHGLAVVDVMTDDGRMAQNADGFAGLTREAARTRVLAELQARGDLVEARPHAMVIGRCQRSNDIVEPRSKTQWFINVRPMAERAVAAVREGRTRFVPKRFEKVFLGWMENIHDWNVSRQLWWGHRIPAWYCPDGHITVSDQPQGPDACAACSRPAAELRQDPDIFDTWFSSGLWPFSTLGWPDTTPDLARYYPTTLMETGYDIIFFWVARMMMLGEWLTGREPFRYVYLHGMVRDPLGAKMSKTKGNVVDPLGVMDEVGGDALRFALIVGGAPGADQRIGGTRLERARNFANKLWNAARFVLAARPAEVPPDAPVDLPVASLLGPADRWILARCARAVRDVDEAYATFQLGEAASLLQQAIWSEYCDWYLELAKVELAADRPAEHRAATWRVLAGVLDRYLRLLHPLMPFVTEEIWGRLPHGRGDSPLLIVAEWPEAGTVQPVASEGEVRAVEAVLQLITAIRNTRAEAGVEERAVLDASIAFADRETAGVAEQLRDAIGRLARVRPALVADPSALGEAATNALIALTPNAEARLTADASLVDRERARLARELTETNQRLAAARAPLANPQFVERARPDVVAGARARVAELEGQVARLQERLDQLA